MSSYLAKTVLSLVCMLCWFPLTGFAGTIIHVPADQPTIQAGIDAASGGDTVQVSAGAYHENIDFHGKAITVTSEKGPGLTVIDGGQPYYSTVNFSSNETTASVLSGFTVQNSNNQGIYISNSSPTIKWNVISGASQSYTNGLYVQGGSPVIQSNLIVGNRQSGITVYSDSGIQITGNLIASNAVGVTLNYSNGTDVIQQNTITGNSSTGLAAYSFGNSLNLIQNLVLGNTGAGIYLSGGPGPVTMVNNTVTDNQPGCCGGNASEIFIGEVSNQITLQNNLLIATGSGSALWCQQYLSPPVFMNNDVFSAGNTAYGGSCPDLTGTNGNQSTDPVFVDLLGDNVHLQAGSPMIDAGTNAASPEPTVDFDGDPRVAGGTVDIGADEYSKKPTVAISLSSLHFAGQRVGTTSSPQVVTLTNNGKTAIPLNLIATGPNFAQTNNCAATLPAGGSCRISVTFSPAGGGAISSALGIFTDASANPKSVSLLGTGLAPQVQINGNFYFYNQVIGTQVTQTGTLTNVGQAPLSISSIEYTGATDFSESNDCPIQPNALAVGAACTISVTFTPTIAGYQYGNITATDNAQPNTQSININGSSVSAGIPVLNPTSLTFPTTIIGQSSAPQTATLTNTGTGPLGIQQIYSYNDFPQTNDCPAYLAVNSSCTLTVTFTPTNQGNENGFLSISTDSAYFQVSLNATGTGQAPVPTLSSLSLASVAAGSPDTSMTLTGSGFTYNSRVLWNGVALPYSYSYGNTQINFTIPAGNLVNTGVDQISVFTPQPGGGTSSALPFTVYTPINYAQQSVAYKYRAITGTNLNLSYYNGANIDSPFPIQYGGGSYTTMTVSGSGTISFSNFVYPYNAPLPTNQTQTLIAPFWATLYPWGSGSDNNVFWAVTGTAPNRQLVVEWRNIPYCCNYRGGTVRFEVVFFEGSSNVQFNYADTVFGGADSFNDNGATATVGVQVTSNLATQFSFDTPSLAGKTSLLWYPSAPTVTVSASTLDFGYHKIGSPSRPQKFTLTNGGLVAANITDVSLSNADFTQTNDCGSTVDPGKSCTFLVRFNPSQPFAETATLSITDNGMNSPQTVNLSGIGAIQPIVVFPIQLNFGGVTVGQSSTLPVTLANAANTKLTIQQITTSDAAFVATSNCGVSLAPGANCTVNVTFTPTKPGNATAKLLMGLNGKAAVPEAKLVGNGQ